MSEEGLVRAAIVYDFDGTLAPGSMQEHGFLPAHGLVPSAFWTDVKGEAAAQDADEILMYMWRMLRVAQEQGKPLTREALRGHGEGIRLFPGVDTWFDRIQTYAAGIGLRLEHHVISSGNQEIIEGCTLRPKLTSVFGSRYAYAEDGAAVWPAVAINYTNKTQFLFRINKGITSVADNERINRWQPMNERPLPFERMIFLGDGETDVPSMKMVRHQGGCAVGVYDPDEQAWRQEKARQRIYNLIAEDRVNFVAPGDYTDGSLLDVTVKGVLGQIARKSGFRPAESGR